MYIKLIECKVQFCFIFRSSAKIHFNIKSILLRMGYKLVMEAFAVITILIFYLNCYYFFRNQII